MLTKRPKLPASRFKSLRYRVKGEGEPCKQGETSTQSGCVPAEGEAKQRKILIEDYDDAHSSFDDSTSEEIQKYLNDAVFVAEQTPGFLEEVRNIFERKVTKTKEKPIISKKVAEEFKNSIHPDLPLVVYRGSYRSNFDLEQAENFSDWTFWSPTKEYAEEYGPNLTAAYVQIKNPLDLRSLSGIEELSSKDVLEKLNEVGVNIDLDAETITPSGTELPLRKLIPSQAQIHDILRPMRDQISELALELGFDGLVQNENYDGRESESWVSFAPKGKIHLVPKDTNVEDLAAVLEAVEGGIKSPKLPPTQLKSLPGWETKNIKPDRKAGCLLAYPPDDVRKALADWTRENVPEFWLGPDGYENQIHTTICYGFEDADEATLQAVRMLVARAGPLKIRLGHLAGFPAGKDGVPFYVSVDSPSLVQLHEEIVAALNVPQNHPQYVPHVNLAYLQDEATAARCAEYPFPFAGQEVQLTSVEFSGPGEFRESIPLLSWFGKDIENYDQKAVAAAPLLGGPKPAAPKVKKPKEEKPKPAPQAQKQTATQPATKVDTKPAPAAKPAAPAKPAGQTKQPEQPKAEPAKPAAPAGQTAPKPQQQAKPEPPPTTKPQVRPKPEVPKVEGPEAKLEDATPEQVEQRNADVQAAKAPAGEGGSYFANAPRDEHGHVLPKNEADRTGQGGPEAKLEDATPEDVAKRKQEIEGGPEAKLEDATPEQVEQRKREIGAAKVEALPEIGGTLRNLADRERRRAADPQEPTPDDMAAGKPEQALPESGIKPEEEELDQNEIDRQIEENQADLEKKQAGIDATLAKIEEAEAAGKDTVTIRGQEVSLDKARALAKQHQNLVDRAKKRGQHLAEQKETAKQQASRQLEPISEEEYQAQQQRSAEVKDALKNPQVVEENNTSSYPYSVQEVAAEQDWHSQYINWAYGGGHVGPNDAGVAVRFVTGLTNPAMGEEYAKEVVNKISDRNPEFLEEVEVVVESLPDKTPTKGFWQMLMDEFQKGVDTANINHAVENLQKDENAELLDALRERGYGKLKLTENTSEEERAALKALADYLGTSANPDAEQYENVEAFLDKHFPVKREVADAQVKKTVPEVVRELKKRGYDVDSLDRTELDALAQQYLEKQKGKHPGDEGSALGDVLDKEFPEIEVDREIEQTRKSAAKQTDNLIDALQNGEDPDDAPWKKPLKELTAADILAWEAAYHDNEAQAVNHVPEPNVPGQFDALKRVIIGENVQRLNKTKIEIPEVPDIDDENKKIAERAYELGKTEPKPFDKRVQAALAKLNEQGEDALSIDDLAALDAAANRDTYKGKIPETKGQKERLEWVRASGKRRRAIDDRNRQQKWFNKFNNETKEDRDKRVMEQMQRARDEGKDAAYFEKQNEFYQAFPKEKPAGWDELLASVKQKPTTNNIAAGAPKAPTVKLLPAEPPKTFDWYARKVLPPYLPKSIVSYPIKAQGEPCQPGETTAKTGCVTQQGESAKQEGDEEPDEAEPDDTPEEEKVGRPKDARGKAVTKKRIVEALEDEDARRDLLRVAGPNRDKILKLMAQQFEEQLRKEYEEIENDVEQWQDEANELLEAEPTEVDVAKANRKLEKTGNPYRFVRTIPDPPITRDVWEDDNPPPDEPEEEEPEEPEEWIAAPEQSDYNAEEIYKELWGQVDAALKLNTTTGISIYKALLKQYEITQEPGELIGSAMKRVAEAAAKQRYEWASEDWNAQQAAGGFENRTKQWKQEHAAWEKRHDDWEKEHAAWEKEAEKIEAVSDAWDNKHGEAWAEQYETPYALKKASDLDDWPGRKSATRIPPTKLKFLPSWKTKDLVPEDVIKVKLPDFVQTTDYGCGAVAAFSICSYFGVGPETEQDFMMAMGSDPDEGTSPEAIAAKMQEWGLLVSAREGMTVEQLKLNCDRGIPTLVVGQAWDDENPNQDYDRDDSGHYLIVIGYDGMGLYFEDSSLKGRRGFVEYADFERRWHDVGRGGKRYVRWGLAAWKPTEVEEIKTLALHQFTKSANRFLGQDMVREFRALLQRLSQMAGVAMPAMSDYQIAELIDRVVGISRGQKSLDYETKAAKKKDDCRWVTLEGGTHVCISGRNGTVKKGPKGWKDKPLPKRPKAKKSKLKALSVEEPQTGEKSWQSESSGGAIVAPPQQGGRRKRADQLVGGDVIEWHGGSRTVAVADHAGGGKIEIRFNDGTGTVNGSDAFEVTRNLYRKRLPKSMLGKSLRYFVKGGKTGKALSKAIAKDGYDGIVTTVGDNETREIVDLSTFVKPGLPSLPPTKLNKSLRPFVKGSYFDSCPRDEAGHCLPKDEADRTGQEKPSKAKRTYKKRGYQDKIPAIDLKKPPLQLVSEDEMQTLNKLASCLSEEDRKYFDENPEALWRAQLDPKRLHELFTDEEIERLSSMPHEEGRLFSKTGVYSEGGVQSEYTLTKTGKDKRGFQLSDMKELKPPQTKTDVNLLLMSLKSKQIPYDMVAEYLDVDKDQLLADPQGTLNEMLYRAYNPIPVWDRIDKDAQVQKTLESLASLEEELKNDADYAAYIKVEDDFTALFNKISDQITALNEEIYHPEFSNVEVPRKDNGYPNLEAIYDKLTEIVGPQLVDKVADPFNRRFRQVENVAQRGEMSAEEAMAELERMAQNMIGSATARAKRYNLEVESEQLSRQFSDFVRRKIDTRKEFMNKHTSKLLRVKSPAIVSVDVGGDHTQDESRSVADAVQWLHDKIAKGPAGQEPRKYKVIKDDTDRLGRGGPSAYYSPNDHAINVPTGMTSTATNVHELAHGLEFEIPGVQSAALRFLQHRVKDQKFSKLKEILPDHGYADWEEGRDDDFAKSVGKAGAWYVGKRPLGNGATEVVSMGVEQLYKDPAGFAKKDPEYCGFIVGVLNGRIRDKEVPA